MVTVELIGPRFWRVADGCRNWSVRGGPFGSYLILNGRGCVVPSSGPTGKRVLAAIR